MHPSPPTRRELIIFGCVLSLILWGLGGYRLCQGLSWGILLLIAGALVAVGFGMQWPPARYFYALWMRIALIMGRLMTTVLLTLIFLLVVTPIGLIARLAGKIFLEREFRGQRTSYWEKGGAPSDLRKQY